MEISQGVENQRADSINHAMPIAVFSCLGRVLRRKIMRENPVIPIKSLICHFYFLWSIFGFSI